LKEELLDKDGNSFVAIEIVFGKFLRKRGM
jgi:hypothetical protein